MLAFYLCLHIALWLYIDARFKEYANLQAILAAKLIASHQKGYISSTTLKLMLDEFDENVVEKAKKIVSLYKPID